MVMNVDLVRHLPLAAGDRSTSSAHQNPPCACLPEAPMLKVGVLSRKMPGFKRVAHPPPQTSIAWRSSDSRRCLGAASYSDRGTSEGVLLTGIDSLACVGPWASPGQA